MAKKGKTSLDDLMGALNKSKTPEKQDDKLGSLLDLASGTRKKVKKTKKGKTAEKSGILSNLRGKFKKGDKKTEDDKEADKTSDTGRDADVANDELGAMPEEGIEAFMFYWKTNPDIQRRIGLFVMLRDLLRNRELQGDDSLLTKMKFDEENIKSILLAVVEKLNGGTPMKPVDFTAITGSQKINKTLIFEDVFKFTEDTPATEIKEKMDSLIRIMSRLDDLLEFPKFQVLSQALLVWRKNPDLTFQELAKKFPGLLVNNDANVFDTTMVNQMLAENRGVISATRTQVQPVIQPIVQPTPVAATPTPAQPTARPTPVPQPAQKRKIDPMDLIDAEGFKDHSALQESISLIEYFSAAFMASPEAYETIFKARFDGKEKDVLALEINKAYRREGLGIKLLGMQASGKSALEIIAESSPQLSTDLSALAIKVVEIGNTLKAMYPNALTTVSEPKKQKPGFFDDLRKK